MNKGFVNRAPISKKRSLFLIALLVMISRIHASSPSSFADIVEKAIPAVVFIAQEVNSFDQAYRDPVGYQHYFRPLYEYFWPSQYSHGSGFLISAKGYVLTCAHCVQGATKTLVVIQENGTTNVYVATIVGLDEETDIAVLHLETTEGHEFPYLSFGDSDRVRLGESVIAIGTPLRPALESSVTMGIVSGKERNLGWDLIEGYIQTDTPIYPGNSGGPLLNSLGEVIGVVNSGYRSFQGVRFVTPSNFASSIATQLMANGSIAWPFLGVELEVEVDSAFDVYYFYRNQGALVTRVVPGSPAERAGLTAGDRVVFLDENPISSQKTFINRLLTIPPSKIVQLKINRQGNLLSITLELDDRQNWKRQATAI